MIQTTTARLVLVKFLQRRAATSRGGVYSSDKETLRYKNHIILAQWKDDAIILAHRSVVDIVKQYNNIAVLISFAKIRRIPLYVARKGIEISPNLAKEYFTKYTRNYYNKFKNCGSRTAEFYRERRKKKCAEAQVLFAGGDIDNMHDVPPRLRDRVREWDDVGKSDDRGNETKLSSEGEVN